MDEVRDKVLREMRWHFFNCLLLLVVGEEELSVSLLPLDNDEEVCGGGGLGEEEENDVSNPVAPA